MITKQERDNLLNTFRLKFPIESLKNMTLEQYTDITEDENGNKKENDSFTYWVENKTRALGSIRGGSSFKFKIYKFVEKTENAKFYSDDKYAWSTELGTDRNIAWEKTKEIICKVAELALHEKFDEIDKINDLWDCYKWKIAFLYSDKKILNVFKIDALLFFCKRKKIEISSEYENNFIKLNSFLLSKKESKEDFWDYSDKLWNEWNNSKEKKKSILKALKENLDDDNNFCYCEDKQDAINGKGNFIWVGTKKDNLIGKRNCHYEYIFSNDGKKLLTEVHFEYKGPKEIYTNICEEQGLKQMKKGHQIWYCFEEDAIDIDSDDDYIQNARKALYRLDSAVGEKLKEVLSMNNKSKLVLECKTLLENTHNLILHGAPGTGKTFLAKQIAEAMECTEKEIGFVQFHPSYDYTDFVEGLRPIKCDNENIGFERKDGVFKEFCKKVLKSSSNNHYIIDFDNIYNSFINDVSEKGLELETLSYKKKFNVKINGNRNLYAVPKTEVATPMCITKEMLKDYLETGKIRDWKSYVTAIGEYIKKNFNLTITEQINSKEKKYVFIIDEINRGELSKIFGELFFCIDPGYRGVKGKIKTQYQNLIEKDEIFGDSFYIPDNVYIIGTMNDIDRSVENMDFAFRRRFTFKEIKATDTAESIINSTDKLTQQEKEKAITRMNVLNNAIEKIEGLSSAYHIGGAYFKKLETLKEEKDKFEALWNYHLEGLLREYSRGIENSEDTLEKLKKAYDNQNNEQKEN